MISDSYNPATVRECPACGVKVDGDSVYFSFPPGGSAQSKERLFARVCQFAKKTGCINTVANLDNCTAKDFYNNGEEIKIG
jgi:hypothetical protein